MRNLFLFLLLVNVLAFAYQRWILEPGAPVAPDYIPQDVPQLIQAERNLRQQSESGKQSAVVSQLPVAKAPPVGSAPASPIPEREGEPRAVARTADKCLRIGPFIREADVGVVQRELERRQATVQRGSEAGRIWVGYWVQTDTFPSRQAAEAARKSLISKDMPDIYVIAEDNEYRVSLGVFRLRASAEDVVKRARSRGFTTRLIERYQPGTNYWLNVRISADRDLSTGELPNTPGQILRSETVPCRD